jgi:hypothetical protein
MTAKQGLRTDATTRGKGGGEDQVHVARRGSGGSGSIVRTPDLSQNLRLSKDLGVQAGGDREEMAACVQAIVPQQRDSRLSPASLGEAAKPGLEIAFTGPVELASVAGRKQKGGSTGRELLFEVGSDLCRCQSKPLPLLHRRHMVADPNNME